MYDRFPASDFDEWAATYDQDVAAEHGFPFTGYRQTLRAVFEESRPQPGQYVLDLGIGTGNLAEYFMTAGCRVVGLDYSAAMLARAADRFPTIQLYQADLRAGLPDDLSGPFDHIVSGYAFHHFELCEIVSLIGKLASRLAPDGQIIIADIAFPDHRSLEQARKTLPDWEEEHYWVAELALPALQAAGFSARFRPVPPYAGIFVIRPNPS